MQAGKNVLSKIVYSTCVCVCICVSLFQMGSDARKPVFRGLRTTQAQTSLRIRAVWSGPLLFTFWKVSYVNLLQVKFNYLASLCSWGDWFETRFVRNPEDRFCCDEAHL